MTVYDGQTRLGGLTLFYLLFRNTCVRTVRKLIFDRFSFGDFDGSPVVNMNSGAEKGTNAPAQALRGVESPQVCAVLLSGNIVCVCAHVCLTRLYSTTP